MRLLSESGGKGEGRGEEKKNISIENSLRNPPARPPVKNKPTLTRSGLRLHRISGCQGALDTSRCVSDGVILTQGLLDSVYFPFQRLEADPEESVFFFCCKQGKLFIGMTLDVWFYAFVMRN